MNFDLKSWQKNKINKSWVTYENWTKKDKLWINSCLFLHLSPGNIEGVSDSFMIALYHFSTVVCMKGASHLEKALGRALIH